jgi:hypothetical protein
MQDRDVLNLKITTVSILGEGLWTSELVTVLP